MHFGVDLQLAFFGRFGRVEAEIGVLLRYFWSVSFLLVCGCARVYS